ncbi:hypothetical protein D3C86_2005430 [compost metagenome]
MRPAGKIYELKFIQPVAGFGILKQLGIDEMHVVAHNDDMLIIMQVQEQLIFGGHFFYRNFLFGVTDPQM